MILQLLIAWLATKIHHHQDQVIRYLREENRIQKAQCKGKRIPLTDTERRRLAVLAHPIARKDLQDLATIATPDTLQRWYRRLVAHAPSRTPQGASLGRPRVAMEIEQLVVRMTTENPRWGSRRIQGALSNLGLHIHNTTVRNILRRNHMEPASIRGRAGMSWSQFVKLHLEVLAASGLFEARLSPCVCLWTAVIHLGRNLSARGVQGLGVMRHGAMRVLALVTQQGHVLRSRCLRPFGIRCLLVFGRRECVPEGTFPTLSLVEPQPVALQGQGSPIGQERGPPGARPPACILLGGHLNHGRNASHARCAAASQRERESGGLFDHSQRTTASDGWYAVAA